MLKKRSIFLFSAILFFACAEKKELKTEKKEGKSSKIELISTSGFPKNWMGKWVGELKIDNTEKDTVFQISRDDVAVKFILVTNKLIGEQMLFEVIFSRRDSVNITGGSAANIPSVNSYPITVYQRAVLEKQ